MSDGKGVLFIGHHASRTGAPLLLLHFLRWIAENTTIPFEVLLTNGGELVEEYAKLAPTRVLNGRGANSRFSRLVRRVENRLRLGSSAERIARDYPPSLFPVVYSNTVANGELVAAFGQRGHRVICHAHEMKFSIEQWGGAAARKSSVYLQTVIAASRAVKRDVARAWFLPDERIEVIHEFGQPQAIPGEATRRARQRIRGELGVSGNDILVGMCGTMDWRKGGDVFLQLARVLLDRSGAQRYRFVWIGGPVTRAENVQLRHDLEMLGVEYGVTIAGQVQNPQDYMSACDVFALTSREDPCPLAMLEAAALGLPVVCFAHSGGATDFVADDAGVVVPYLDVGAMADAIAKLAADPETRRRMGEQGRRRAATGYSLESQAPQLLRVLETHLNPAPAASLTAAVV